MASISSMEAQVNKHIECCQHGQRIQTNDFASGSAIESGYPEWYLYVLLKVTDQQ